MMYNDLTIAVVGDIMLDHWREGTEYKLNPESPTIDIINPTNEYTLGGAGNVARIVKGLGASVSLFGTAGYGSDTTIEELCVGAGIDLYLVKEERLTTQKERIVCGGKQICRISYEDTRFISIDTANALIAALDVIATRLDGIIVADYSKGVMSDRLIGEVMTIASKNGIPVLVDPKDRLYIYKECTIMKPNHKELGRLDKGDLFHRLDCDHFVVTSPCKIMWRSRGGVLGEVFAHPVEVANVSGAGDAVAAVLLMEYIRSGGDIKGAVELANWGASKVVQQERAGHLTVEDLEEFTNERGEATKGDISGQRRSDQ